MSDTIQPLLQQPTKCDFGPFAGKVCYMNTGVPLMVATSKIDIQNINLQTDENTTLSINLADSVISVSEIDWPLTQFTGLPSSNGTISITDSIAKFTPNTTAAANRTVTFNFEVTDKLGKSEIGIIQIMVIDKSPTISVSTANLSGPESQTFTLDIKTKTSVSNTTVNWSDPSSVVITTQPTEGTVTITNGILTFIPSELPNNNRSVQIKFNVKTVDDLIATGILNVSLTDITPALSSRDAVVTLLDTENKTINITSSLTIKNDTFKSVTTTTPSEGTITINGSNIKFTPNSDLGGTRIIVIDYTVITTSGLTSTSKITFTINDDNIWSKTVWYGNSVLDKMDEAGVIALSDTIKQNSNKGSYNFVANPGSTPVYKWIVFPKAYGIPPIEKVFDGNNFEMAMDDYQYFTVNGIELLAMRSWFQLNGSSTIKIV